MKNICAVIVTFNTDVEKLKLQLARLIIQVNAVIIVDNNSNNCDDIITALVNVDYKDIVVIKNDENIGLAAAQNKGIRKSIELGGDFVLLLDDDSLVEENFIENLMGSYLELQSQQERIGAIGPVYYNKQTGEQYPITRYIGPFIKRRLPKNTPCEASFLIASGCLISIEVLTAVGMMNEELFIDYIDVEWSFRARNKGYKLYATPNASMNHIIGEKRLNILGRKVSYHSSLRKYYLFRNSIYMIKCPYISIGYKIREIVFNTLRFVVYLCYSKNKKTFIKYSLRGLYDGLKGKMGECEYQF